MVHGVLGLLGSVRHGMGDRRDRQRAEAYGTRWKAALILVTGCLSLGWHVSSIDMHCGEKEDGKSMRHLHAISSLSL